MASVAMIWQSCAFVTSGAREDPGAGQAIGSIR